MKLLKLVVLSEKLKTYKEQRRTATTYAEIAKLLFCISKFPELKDTQEQETVADLCAEAKSLVSWASDWSVCVHVITLSFLYMCAYI